MAHRRVRGLHKAGPPRPPCYTTRDEFPMNCSNVQGRRVLLTEERTVSTQMLVEVDAQKLQKLRRRRLWLIGDLAERSGVHRNTISKLENGKGGAYPETIRKL